MLVSADRILFPSQVGQRRRGEGVHRQPHRRRRISVGDVLHRLVFWLAALHRRDRRCAQRPFRHRRSHYHRRDFVALCRSLRKIGAASALHLAARCHGRPHAGIRADPCCDHGHGWRLHGRAIERAVCARAHVDEDGCHRRRADRDLRRLHRTGAERHQARAGVLHRLATWLHVSRARRGSFCRRRFPRLHACLFQGVCSSSAPAP